MGVVEDVVRFPFTEYSGLELPAAAAGLLGAAGLTRVVLPYGGQAWLATAHEHVRLVMSDPRFSRAAATAPDMPRQMPGQYGDGTILDVDRPAHSRLRRLVAHAFTRERMGALAGEIAGIAERLLAGMDGVVRREGHVDLVAHYALPLPMTVICGLLGVPVADREHFRALTEGVLAIRTLDEREFAAVAQGLDDYLTGLVRERRARPGRDVLSLLIAARDDRDQLDEQELISFGATLLAAGYETTASHLSSAAYLVLTRPEVHAGVRERRRPAERVVDELLRFIPMNGGSGLPRVALDDVEVGTTTVRAGEVVFASTVAANHDPGVFGAPGLDLDRADNPHLTFGHGFHHCLGAHLVRVESRVSLAALFGGDRRVRLAVRPERVAWKGGTIVRGPEALPVTW